MGLFTKTLGFPPCPYCGKPKFVMAQICPHCGWSEHGI